MASQRRWLRDSISRVSLPELSRRGFVVAPTRREESGEIRAGWPFGSHFWVRAGGTDLLEVQINRYGAAFRLNFARIEGALTAMFRRLCTNCRSPSRSGGFRDSRRG